MASCISKVHVSQRTLPRLTLILKEKKKQLENEAGPSSSRRRTIVSQHPSADIRMLLLHSWLLGGQDRHEQMPGR